MFLVFLKLVMLRKLFHYQCSVSSAEVWKKIKRILSKSYTYLVFEYKKVNMQIQTVAEFPV